MSSRPVAGIDLGGTYMQIGIVSGDSGIVADQRMQTEANDGPDTVIERMVEGTSRACATAGIEVSDLAGVGVAAPGAIDIPAGVVLEAPNLGWYDLPLVERLRETLKVPVVVDNDVNAAAWGEHRHGAGRGSRDLLAVWVGTGVGGGLVLDGRLHHGPLHTAGEIGQTTILPDGPPGFRTVEDLCSRSGMARIIADRLPARPGSALDELLGPGGHLSSTEPLAEALSRGDDLATDVVHRAADLLGLAIANWITVLALDLVIVGGGVTEVLGEPFLRRITERFEHEVFPARLRRCRLLMTVLRNNAGLLGAATLARDQSSSSDRLRP